MGTSLKCLELYPRVPLRSPVSPNAGGAGGESSDNDSSTYYGQLKTFESVFESEASPVAEMQVSSEWMIPRF